MTPASASNVPHQSERAGHAYGGPRQRRGGKQGSAPKGESTERAFGYPVGAVCVLLAGAFFWKGKPTVSIVLLSIGAILLMTAWLCPSVLKYPSRWWMHFAHLLGWINSRILLSVFFFLIVTPIGVVMRLAGWDALRIRRAPAGGWQPYPARLRNPKHYERMY